MVSVRPLGKEPPTTMGSKSGPPTAPAPVMEMLASSEPAMSRPLSRSGSVSSILLVVREPLKSPTLVRSDQRSPVPEKASVLMVA